MKSIILQWKSFRLNLPKIEKYLRLTYSNYVGNQAHNHLELYFNDLTSEQEMAVKDYFNSLSETSPESSFEVTTTEDESRHLVIKEKIEIGRRSQCASDIITLITGYTVGRKLTKKQSSLLTTVFQAITDAIPSSTFSSDVAKIISENAHKDLITDDVIEDVNFILKQYEV